ncbi:hypothetical protein [Paraurantiacibacter namhicola]|uniref:Uncharacterized protein n=1 Tax=Paraurantiacibacter namhicola TaxID=645517 RepID=A0A1C7D888_9SPHN|nr:hypothetical protein [Paraurantiacibacter namhicola]ANU07657.1 hypothetical protein A6F65_01351 [Paraurantiacibacter namhicola]
MSIRFAAPPQANAVRLTRSGARRAAKRAAGRPANDNGVDLNDQALLRASLRHFAEHGLAAASHAHAKAEAAFFAGDRKAYDWWLGICRSLDRRMAKRLASSVDRKPDAGSGTDRRA